MRVTTDNLNTRRALTLIRAYVETRDHALDPSDNDESRDFLVDLLADARGVADSLGLDFASADREAYRLYATQVAADGLASPVEGPIEPGPRPASQE